MRPIWILCVLFMSATTGGAVAAELTGSAWHPSTFKRQAVRRHPRVGKYLFGDRTVEAAVDSNRAGIAESFPFTSHTTGTARALRVYVAVRNRARTWIIGLYSNRKGRPGSLLASGTRSSPKPGRWNTVTLRPRVRYFRSRTVHLGTTYWIAVLGRKGRLSFRYRSGGLCHSSTTSARRSLSALPRSWKTGRTSASCPISAYVSGAVSTHGHGKPSPPAPPIKCDLHATPTTFSSQVSAARNGQTVCLAAGNYATWTGTTRAITIAPEPNVSPSLNFDFGTGAANFTIDGGHTGYDSNSPGINLVNDNYFDAGSKNITLENVAVTCNSQLFCLQVRTEGPGIVVTGNVFHDMQYPNNVSGAVWLLPPDTVPASNIVIANNLFRDMGADGIDGGPATIVGNDFSNVNSDSTDPRHTDVIQFGPNNVIEGNFVHNGCIQGIDAFDGTTGNTIEDNVIAGCSVHSLVTAADNPGSLVAHNTVIGAGGLECGSKTGSPPSTTQIRDNILQQGINWGGVRCTPSVDSHNMSEVFGQIHGSSDFLGTPVFVGGAHPSTYGGYALASGSPGKGKVSDGGAVGARVALYPRPPGLQ